MGRGAEAKRFTSLLRTSRLFHVRPSIRTGGRRGDSSEAVEESGGILRSCLCLRQWKDDAAGAGHPVSDSISSTTPVFPSCSALREPYYNQLTYFITP